MRSKEELKIMGAAIEAEEKERQEAQAAADADMESDAMFDGYTQYSQPAAAAGPPGVSQASTTSS
eukprot:2657221-Pyramimonas_sp.AAC.1